LDQEMQMDKIGLISTNLAEKIANLNGYDWWKRHKGIKTAFEEMDGVWLRMQGKGHKIFRKAFAV
jgi:hypothetical protein